MEESRLVTLLRAVYKRRLFLTIYFLIISSIAIFLALNVRKTFTSSALLLPPNSTSLSSFLPMEMTRGLGGAIQSLTGGSGNDTNKILSILYSRSLAEATIAEFDLATKFKSETIEDAIESFNEHIGIEVNDELMVRVSVGMKTEFFHPDEEEVKVLSRDICLFIINYLDTKFTNLQTEKAKYERILVEGRFQQNIEDLVAAEQKLKEFMETYGIISLPEQLEASILSAAEIESQIVLKTIELNSLKNSFNSNNQEITIREIQLQELRNALKKLTSKDNSEFSVLPGIEKSPDLIIEYANLERELTVQNILYEFLIQQVEQFKLQEAKETPSIQFIDQPRVPEKRSKPVRSVMVMGIVFIGGLFGLTYVLFIELYLHKSIDIFNKIR